MLLTAASKVSSNPKMHIKRADKDHSTFTIAFCTFVVAIILGVGLYNIEGSPSLWWDEGWTLNVARNWVERGIYGQLLQGRPHPPGLAASFPTVWPIVISFHLFGVGIWQGRLPGVLCTFGALGLLYHLGRQLYNRSVGWGALYAVLLLLNLGSINPIFNGRQVLADMPLMFYLLAGYGCFLAAWRKAELFLPLAALFWGIAILVKAQTLPFWLLSLALPLVLAILQREWRSAILLLGGIAGSWYISRGLLILQGYTLRGHSVPGEAIQGLYQAIALVALPNVRARALIVLGISGLPTLFGLLYATWQYYKGRHHLSLENGKEVVRLALFLLAGSWLGWFVLLSNSGPRYLAAPGFLGGIFVGAMLYDLTDDFNFKGTIGRAAQLLRLRDLNRSGLGATFAIVIAVPMAIVTLAVFYPGIFSGDSSAREVADYLNTHTPPDSMLETYDSEIFFFLDRPYHYPPDQLLADLLRRYYYEQDFEIDYDPLAVNPDYLVVGPTSAAWHVYDRVLETGEFKLLHVYSRYLLYERAR
jgi:4-amino-4-deoxy-L-arabinose transferase-like glycosyltransferase